MRRAATAVGLVLAAILALAGCVGIPTAGGVQTGPVIASQVNSEFVVLPSGPRAGASQSEILADFMQAVRGPQNDYAIARLFLTFSLATTWKPDASTLIRTDNAITGPSADPNTLTYSVTSRAYVDADGRYFEQSAARQTLGFSFIQEKGEWRISKAADGIVLSQSSFNVVFAQQPLLFFDPSYTYLVPDVRWFPARATLAVRVVRALLAGPSSWLQGAVFTAFPTATTLGKDVGVQSGTATVDLSKEAIAAGSQQRDRMRQQLEATLGPTLNVANVVMTVGGLVLAVPDSTGGGAVVNPQVENALLIGTATAFGFSADSSATDNPITPIGGLSDKVLAAGAVAATLSHDKQSVAMLKADGTVSVARVSGEKSEVLDSRGGLAAPAIDPFNFVWSAVAGNAATLTTYGTDGTEHPVQSGLPTDTSIVSMSLSRDGTRILLYLSTSVGPRLAIAGVIRGDQFVPSRLGELQTLPTSVDPAVDAAWVDDRTVAAVSQAAGVASVTVFSLGGPSSAFGQLDTAVKISGGNGGNTATDGLRILGAGGKIWRSGGAGRWVDTGITATVLGTKQ